MRSRTRAGLAGAFVIGGLVVGGGLLAGCGGDDGGGGGATGGEADVVVHGTDALKFDKDSYSAQAGDVTIELTNDGTTPHTLLIDGDADFQKLEAAGKGKSDSETVALTPGTYTIYCDVPGHRAAGMEATLVVN
jgi:plastocyanin